MSGGENIFSTREWMYKRVNSSGNVVSDEFVDGINQFLSFARNSISFSDEGVILCPCKVCKNRRRFAVNIVGNHLYRQGFMPNYYLWTCHGEGCEIGESSSYAVPMSVDQVMRDDEIPTTYEDFNRVSEMVHDAFPDVAALDLPESPRGDAKIFFNLLEEASEPIYDGGVSRLCLATEMMNMKTEYNLSEVCMDGWARLFKKRLPDNNSAPASYYEVKKMTRSLGLPYQKIDACENNCMLFWKDDISLTICRFCKSERFRPRQDGNKSKNVAKQRMFYLPIADRLKRLFT